MKDEKLFFEIFYKVHSYLDEYIELHNTLVAVKLLQKINFNELSKSSEILSVKISQSYMQLPSLFLSEAITTLRDDFMIYTEALNNTVLHLRGLFLFLDKRANPSCTFFEFIFHTPKLWFQYRKLFKAYEASRKVYAEKGSLINKMLNILKNT